MIRGTTFPAGHVIEPGHVGWDTKGDTHIGPFEPSPAPMSAVEALADACTRAGMPTHALADARGAQWRKVIFNAASNAIAALTGRTHGQVAEPPTRELAWAVMAEGRAVADAQGIMLDMSPEELFDHAARKDVAYGHKPSMLQDVEAGRETEIDFLNGAIVAFGDTLRRRRAAQPRAHTTREREDMTSQAEIDRRYANVRAQAQEDGLDAVVVAGSEYSGFEGAVRYLSGFRMLHRYAYVVLPVEGEPSIVFPKEARWVGDHGESWIEDKVFAEHPGQWIADRGFKKVGVYGLDYVMPVRDYRPLADVAQAWDQGFDTARAVKSEEELASVEESFRLNEDGVRAALAAYEVGKTEAEVMGEAERVFAEPRHVADDDGHGADRRERLRRPGVQAPEPTRRIGQDDLVLYGLEIAAFGGHWVEFSRPFCAGDAVEGDARRHGRLRGVRRAPPARR